MPAPVIRYLSLAEHVTKFSQLRREIRDRDQPDPDLVAARYSLTGWNRTGTYITGISTAQNLLGETASREDMPLVRRDYDSVIGFTRDCPVSTDIAYFPNPPVSRTLTKTVYITHTYKHHGQVRRDLGKCTSTIDTDLQSALSIETVLPARLRIFSLGHLDSGIPFGCFSLDFKYGDGQPTIS
jgi:hypothetical protein